MTQDPYDLAINYLARREHSVVELSQKLKRKGFVQTEITSLIERLQAENKQSDERFAQSLIRSRIAAGKGPSWLEQELLQHGLPSSLVRDLDADWHALAVQARAKRFGLQPIPDQNEKAKQVRFLQYRGFTMQQIYLALEAMDAV